MLVFGMRAKILVTFRFIDNGFPSLVPDIMVVWFVIKGCLQERYDVLKGVIIGLE